MVVLKSNLDSWYDGTVDLQSANVDFCWRKARSVHAFRNAPRSVPPDSSFKISTPFGSTQLLAGDRLIWLDGAENSRQVRVLDLRSWSFRVLNGESREQIRDVYASEEILVFTTYTTAYVTRLDSPGPLKRFRVVNAALLCTVACRGRTVVCAGYLEDCLLVYIWDFDTQTGRSFKVSYETSFLSGCQLDLAKAQPPVGLLLQPDTEAIVLCILDTCKVTDLSDKDLWCPKVLYGQFAYSGECRYHTEQTLEECDHGLLTHSNSRSMTFVPASRSGLFILQSTSRRTNPPFKTVPLLQFDERLNAFTSPERPGSTAFSPRQSHSIAQWNNSEVNLHVVWWKDTFIEISVSEHIVVHRGTASCHRREKILVCDNSELEMNGRRDDWKLLINERYIVWPCCNTFYICCFDHTVKLPEVEGRLGDWGTWERITRPVQDCVAVDKGCNVQRFTEEFQAALVRSEDKR